MPRRGNRLDPLIEILEQGGTVTQSDVNRTATLLALDIVREGTEATRAAVAYQREENDRDETRNQQGTIE